MLAAMRLLLATLAGTLCLQGQWLNYPATGTPRLAGGKPNLSAPAPKKAGKPDLSGMWQVESSPKKVIEPYTYPGGETILGETDISVYFANFFADYKFGEEPFTPAAAAAFHAKHSPPEASCPPARLPNSDLVPVPFKLLQTPGLTLILYEDFENFRQIHTDGRGLPKDPQPTFLGYSAGRWEGDTFVVETNGFNDLAALDAMGHPHSEAMKITERFRRVDFGHMNLQITVDDPVTYAKPVTISVRLGLLPDTDLIESVCELEKDQPHMPHN